MVAAALPIPVTAFHLIPTLSFQTQELSVYTPLFCFLVLAFIFYSRHALARWLFGPIFRTGGIGKQMLVGVIPLIFIIATF